jgi:hypothetical protein
VTAVLSRRLVLPAGELAGLCGLLGLLVPPGFEAAAARIRTDGLLVDDAVHPSVAAGLVATCSPQLAILARGSAGDVAAAWGVRGDLGGSMARAGTSDVEVAAWPALRLGAELRRVFPAGLTGTVRITVVAPPRVVGKLDWHLSGGADDALEIGAAVAPLVAAALS